MDTYHHSSRHRIPLQPEGDERRRHQDNARNEHRGEVESTISCEFQIHFQTAVIA